MTNGKTFRVIYSGRETAWNALIFERELLHLVEDQDVALQQFYGDGARALLIKHIKRGIILPLDDVSYRIDDKIDNGNPLLILRIGVVFGIDENNNFVYGFATGYQEAEWYVFEDKEVLDAFLKNILALALRLDA